MTVELKMPALSPTMEKGTLAKWLVREGDLVKSGDQIAEIETDKATMEFEAADEGRITKILIPEGTDDVIVGTVIAILGASDGDAASAPAASAPVAVAAESVASAPQQAEPAPPVVATPVAETADSRPRGRLEGKVKVSPLAARIAAARDIDLSGIVGTGPGGRIVRADLGIAPRVVARPVEAAPLAAAQATVEPVADVPHEMIKLSGMRKTIARRLTQSKQQVPHIYLSVDIRLDALLALRAEINQGLASRGVKVSVNDMMVKALAVALMQEPACNVQFAGDQMAQFTRADISVAVSIPNGLITPIVPLADTQSLSAIARATKDLAERARQGKLLPHEYQGGTASISNLGMFGIKQFQAVINPPQAMIMAIGSSEGRVIPTAEGFETAQMLCATGSFDHRAIDGADAARLMKTFQQVIEEPLSLIA